MWYLRFCRRLQEPPRHFPTCYPEDQDKLPEEEYADMMHKFDDESIVYPEEDSKKK